MIEIHTLRALSDNFVYVLTHDRAAVVIDPGEAAPVLKFLESRGLELRQILLTHHHPDHVAGVGALVARTPVEVTCSVADLGRIAGATRGVAAGETLEVLGAPVEVLETPGHTLGHVAFYLPRESAVFTGDTLFSAGCGRLFEGTAAQMFESLRRLAALPPATRVYFGHEYTLNNLAFVASRLGKNDGAEVEAYALICRVSLAGGQPTSPSTIAVEAKINPFLRAATVDEFTEWRTARDHW